MERIKGCSTVWRIAALYVVSSCYSNDPIMSEFRSHGISGVICKPYVVEEVAKALAEAPGR